jgi:hypothetical protein
LVRVATSAGGRSHADRRSVRRDPRVGAQRSVARRWTLFAVLALSLYAGLYVAAESLVYRLGERNRFFAVHAAAPDYDVVILGASHAMPLDFADMNRRLQDATGLSILNLSMEGAGIIPNRIVFDYFGAARASPARPARRAPEPNPCVRAVTGVAPKQFSLL